MIEELDTLVLAENLPEYGLERGALGTAVFVHPDGSCEAEFVNPAGETLALVTLSPSQYRPSGTTASSPKGRATDGARPSRP
jgi:hypothetical protein